jgi:hypothetical protein
MKQLMYAELLFDHPEARDRAIVALAKRGFTIEALTGPDWVDEFEGVVLSSTVWIKVRGAYEGSDDEFFNEMVHLTRQFGGDVYEAGYLHPPAVA